MTETLTRLEPGGLFVILRNERYMIGGVTHVESQDWREDPVYCCNHYFW